MTLDDAMTTIDRLVADLARTTGQPEGLVRLQHGLGRPAEPDDLTAGTRTARKRPGVGERAA